MYSTKDHPSYLGSHERSYAGPFKSPSQAYMERNDLGKPWPWCQNHGCLKWPKLRCGKCKSVAYCSKACQKEDWSRPEGEDELFQLCHKSLCGTYVANGTCEHLPQWIRDYKAKHGCWPCDGGFQFKDLRVATLRELCVRQLPPGSVIPPTSLERDPDNDRQSEPKVFEVVPAGKARPKDASFRVEVRYEVVERDGDWDGGTDEDNADEDEAGEYEPRAEDEHRQEDQLFIVPTADPSSDGAHDFSEEVAQSGRAMRLRRQRAAQSVVNTAGNLSLGRFYHNSEYWLTFTKQRFEATLQEEIMFVIAHGEENPGNGLSYLVDLAYQNDRPFDLDLPVVQPNGGASADESVPSQDQDASSPLAYAAYMGDAVAVRYLLRCGASPHALIWRPSGSGGARYAFDNALNAAAHMGYGPAWYCDDSSHYRDIVRMLVGAGCDVNGFIFPGTTDRGRPLVRLTAASASAAAAACAATH